MSTVSLDSHQQSLQSQPATIVPAGSRDLAQEQKSGEWIDTIKLEERSSLMSQTSTKCRQHSLLGPLQRRLLLDCDVLKFDSEKRGPIGLE